MIQGFIVEPDKEMVMTQEDTFGKHYSESGFWNTCRKALGSVGRSLLENALKLFYALQSPATPLWAKGVIVGALGYFISPVDAIPDVVPLIGWSDDAVILAGALVTVSAYITPEMARKARATVADWFD
jgi:uncharacterized membrane protein YkvA (DUF1232 family)